MITHSNIKRYDNLDWQSYQAMPQYSFSFLKREHNGSAPHFVTNDKMKLGSMIDAILTSPATVDVTDPLFKVGRAIASNIMKMFGNEIKQFKPQVSYSGTATLGGFHLPVKGRLDWLLEGHAVCDLKVTDATDIATLIKFMRYDDQMFNYCGLAGVGKAYIFAYSKKLGKPLHPFALVKKPTSKFWEDKIIKFGTI